MKQDKTKNSAKSKASKKTSASSKSKASKKTSASSKSKASKKTGAASKSRAAKDKAKASGKKGSSSAKGKASFSKNGKQKKGHRGLLAFFVVIAVLVLACIGGYAALASDDAERITKVPSKTILDGKVDVSGMTAEELEKTINARVKSGFATKAKLELNGKTYEVDLSKVGVVDTEPTITAAFAPYSDDVLERYVDRVKSLVSNEEKSYQITTSLSPSKKKLKKVVEKLAAQIDVAAVDAGYVFENGKPTVTKSSTGLKVDVDKTVSALKEALSDSTEKTVEVKGVVDKVEPAKKEAGQAIYVNTSSCKVTLYQNGKVKVSYPCTPGKKGYETPKGDFTLSYKDPAPTWYNPHSDWSKNMPETIAPGASNPLGLRALALSCGGGIYIHGTTNTAGLGKPGSHGCIRLANANIVKLYDMVQTGIPIYVR